MKTFKEFPWKLKQAFLCEQYVRLKKIKLVKIDPNTQRRREGGNLGQQNVRKKLIYMGNFSI